MSPEIIQALLTTCEAVSAATLAAVLAVLFTHRLTIDRDRINGMRNRKRNFLAFLDSWKHEIGRLYMHEGGGGLEYHESNFKDMLSQFRYEAGILKWDFAGKRRDEFITLCDKVVGGKHRSIYGKELNDAAQKDIDELIAFVEQN